MAIETTGRPGVLFGLTSVQTRLVMLAWVTYAAFYFGRVNLAPVITSLQSDLGWSKTEIGLLGTVFFWTYGIGQLINGSLGDRVGARGFITFGLVGSAIANFLFGASSIFAVMLVIWAANGYFQAMGWGPILQMLANNLSAEQRTRVSSVFGSSFVVGNAATWLLMGWLLTWTNWRGAFYFAAPLLLFFAGLWWFGMRNWRTGDTKPHAPADAVTYPLREFLARPEIWIACGVAILIGIVQGGFFVWTPTLLVEVQGVPLSQAAFSAVLFPVAGSIGIFVVAAWIRRTFGDARAPTGLALLLGVLGVMIFIYRSAVTAVPFGIALVLLAFIGAIALAATSLILTMIPMRVGGTARSSTAAGAINFAFNLGASLTSVVTGVLLDQFSWNAVFLFWMIVALSAALLLGINLRHFRSIAK